MRGIVFTGEKAEVTDRLAVRGPGPTEVTVRIGAAGVCHSDVSVIDGTIPWPAPAVLGHEGAGVVEEVGAAVTSLEPGDHVVLTTLANCGLCAACNTGHPTRCRRSLGNMSQPFTLDGRPAYNFAACSVFTELTVVSETQAVRIDPAVPLESACLIGCGVLTGVGAVLNRARVTHGETAAVFGVGGIGLNVIQALRLCDAGRVIAIDTVPGKEALARQFGATDFIDSRDTDVRAAVKAILPYGVDWSFECVGHPTVGRTAIDILDWGGTAVLIGTPPPGAEVSAPVLHLTHVDRGVMGCRYGSVRPHHDIPLFVDLYLQGRLKLDELVSKTYPLEGFEDVVADMHDGKLARGVLTLT